MLDTSIEFRKAMKRIALLLCLAALLSAALASDADPYRDIATDIASAARALPGKTIAVMPFETAMGSDAGFARYAADKLTHELVSAGGVIVVERSKIARVVSEQELSASGAVSGDELSRLGRLLAVDALVFGTVSGAGGQREILVRLIDIRTGSILRSVSNTAPVENEHSSDASQATIDATSSTRSKRAIGIFDSMKSMCCWLI